MEPIGPAEFSSRTGLSAKALRLYAERGLLEPAHVDPDTGYRTYTSDQLDRAGRIALLRRAGISLADIASFLDDPSTDTVHAWIADMEAEHRHQRDALNAIARSLTTREDAPMETFTIRPVRSLEELLDAFDMAGGQFDPPITRHTDGGRLADLTAAFPDQREIQIVAEHNGNVVGAALGFLGDSPNATLRILAVTRDQQGRGLGASLLQAFERGVAALGGESVWLGADNNPGFYIRHGYRTMLLLQWVHHPDRFEHEMAFVLEGPAADMDHWTAEFAGVPQLFIVLDEPDPRIRRQVADLATGAHTGYCMSRDVMPIPTRA